MSHPSPRWTRYVAPTSARAKRPFKSLLKPWLAHGSARRKKPGLIFSLSVGPCGGCWARNSGGGAPTVWFYLSSQTVDLSANLENFRLRRSFARGPAPSTPVLEESLDFEAGRGKKEGFLNLISSGPMWSNVGPMWPLPRLSLIHI